MIQRNCKELLFMFVFVLFCMSSHGQSFKRMPGKGIDVALNPTNGKVYVVGVSNNVFSFEKETNIFKPHLGEVNAKRIAIAPSGSPWIVQENKKVSKTRNAKWEVVNPITYSSDITFDRYGNAWSCFAINGRVVKYDGKTWTHDKFHSSGADRIAVKSSSDIWVVKKDNSIRRYFKKKWIDLPGKAIDIAWDAKTNEIYVVGISNRIFKWNKGINDWELVRNTRDDVSTISVYNNNIWCTTTDNNIYSTQLADNNSFPFSANKRKVIVLVHGITASKNGAGGISNGVDTERHPQFYWGYDFIRNLIGVPQNEKLVLVAPKSKSFPPYSIPDYLWADHRYSITLRQDKSQMNIKDAYVLKHRASSTDVMCTFRDGGLGLMDQTKAAINQIYDAYQEHYGHLGLSEQPMIYLVAHSFGGIVCRTILTNPTAVDKNNVKLTVTERQRADFIRNRTVWLTTLSTPHQGSPLPEIAQKTDKDLKKYIDGLTLPYQQGLAKDLEWVRKEKVDGQKICLNDIKYNDFYLKNMLRPQLAKRSNGDLIPIYTLTGSNPGYNFFLRDRTLLSPYDNSILDIREYHNIQKEDRGYHKLGFESFLLLFLEMISGSDKWTEVYPNTNVGDKFKVQTGKSLTDIAITEGIKIEMKSDGIFDTDGFVGFESGHGLRLNGADVEYFSGKKDGSWYRIYGNNYGLFHPWDLDNHRSICYNTGTSAFIGNYLMEKGPFAERDIWSSWEKGKKAAPLKKKRVRLEITGLGNLSGQDFGSDGFRVEVKIGQGGYQNSGVINKKTLIGFADFQENQDYVWTFSEGIPNATIVPVIIKVINYRALLDDQLCSGSKTAYMEEIVLYVDTKTNRIYGEIEGPAGSTIHTTVGHKKSKRRVQLKFRVEVENM